ncbi:hypothetical protein WISP_31580 [Willisornis vidua]|uniref:Uncharacterized protein n=1 Tax=Willisornis vidua TaxID=1566151 RepID=A0ABQ9DJY4_9PASS|nr:hypothetical protein WISP_31580 [Willisornis vidua]
MLSRQTTYPAKKGSENEACSICMNKGFGKAKLQPAKAYKEITRKTEAGCQQWCEAAGLDSSEAHIGCEGKLPMRTGEQNRLLVGIVWLPSLTPSGLNIHSDLTS